MLFRVRFLPAFVPLLVEIKRCDPQLLKEAKSLQDAGAKHRSFQDARERAPRQICYFWINVIN
ncbi:MAG: hypothetical protein AAGM46_01895 [Cyanobacteria bacterium J06582_2]